MPAKNSGARAIRASAGFLIVVGVLAALSRYVLPHDLHMTIARPLYRDFADGQLPVEAAHPVPEALHRVGGALFLLLGAMQFSPRLRARRPALHRLSGRIFIGLSLVAVATAIYMSLVFPYSEGERLPTLVFGAFMGYAVLRAFVHIRRRQVQAHREWMTRAFTVGLGVSTIRLLGVGASYATGISVKVLIGPAFWAGWIVSLAVAEWWIRENRTVQSAAAQSAPSSAAATTGSLL